MSRHRGVELGFQRKSLLHLSRCLLTKSSEDLFPHIPSIPWLLTLFGIQSTITFTSVMSGLNPLSLPLSPAASQSLHWLPWNIDALIDDCV